MTPDFQKIAELVTTSLPRATIKTERTMIDEYIHQLDLVLIKCKDFVVFYGCAFQCAANADHSCIHVY